MSASDDIDDSAAPLIEHLAELRTRLIRSVIAVTVAAIAVYAFFNPIFDLLQEPYCQFQAENATSSANAAGVFGAEAGAFGARIGKNKLGRSFFMPIPWGNIPARPYLGVGTADSVAIVEEIEDWLAEGFEVSD